MSHNNVEIKEGAFIISDVHYSHLRPEFLAFVKEIDSKELKPTQIIFMGDIFDTLFGYIPYTHHLNSELIILLNKISDDIEIIYLEGNHDFNLNNIFKNIKVYKISNQPVVSKYNDKRVLLAHGDIQNSLKYNIYTTIIRSRIALFMINILDLMLNHTIFNKLDNYLSKKDDCKEFIGFHEFISERLEDKYSCDYFIEGHFHQNKRVKLKNFTYINLGAFACNQRYFIVKSSEDNNMLEEKMFSKEI